MANKNYPYPFNENQGSKFLSGNGTWKDVYTKEQIDENEHAIAGAMADMDERLDGFDESELVAAHALTFLDENKENACQLRYVHGDTQALDSDVFYVFELPVSSLTLTFNTTPSTTHLSIYGGTFTAAGNDIQITLPSGVSVTEGSSDISAGQTYEFNIMNGVCIIADVTLSADISDGGNSINNPIGEPIIPQK